MSVNNMAVLRINESANGIDHFGNYRREKDGLCQKLTIRQGQPDSGRGIPPHFVVFFRPISQPILVFVHKKQEMESWP